VVNNQIQVRSATSTTPSAPDQTAAQSSSNLDRECEQNTTTRAVWISGSIDLGSDSIRTFDSDGLTTGGDFVVFRRLIVGGAAGAGFSHDEAGKNGTRTDGSSATVMGYASYAPRPGVYVDALIGGSRLSLDNERYLPDALGIAPSTRKGGLRFGSASLAGETRFNGVTVAGYGRYDYVSIALRGFSERSASSYALTFGSADQAMRVSVLGWRVDKGYARSWGTMRPLARLEYRHRFAGSFDQVMAYSDMPQAPYTLSGHMSERDLLSASVGATVTNRTFTLGLEYGTSATSLSNFDGSSFRVMLRRGF